MKKILLGIFALLVFLIPLAAAEDVSEGSADADIKDIKAMDTAHGAEMRLLQLEEAITKNIIKGRVIAASIDSAELDLILEEMEALKLEIQSADPASEDAVQVFVDLKKDAQELSKSFRDTARSLADESKAEELKAKVKDLKDDKDLKAVRDKIKEKRQEYNEEKMSELFGRLGLENKDELIARVRAANAELKAVHDIVKEKLSSMTPEERKEAMSGMKEAGMKRSINARGMFDDAKKGMDERKGGRMAERFGKMEKGMNGEFNDAFKMHKEGRMGMKAEQIEEMTAFLEEHRGEMAEYKDEFKAMMESNREEFRKTGPKPDRMPGRGIGIGPSPGGEE